MTPLLVLAAALTTGPLEAAPLPEAGEPQVFVDGESVRIFRRYPGRVAIRIPVFRRYSFERDHAVRDRLRDRIRDSFRAGRLRREIQREVHRDIQREIRERIRERVHRPLLFRRYRFAEPI